MSCLQTLNPTRVLTTNFLATRYHKAHGHQTQQLHENGDGTFSIVNPETSAPYPGTMGMEKEKPFNCETCGKRYKNLNGLKYVSNIMSNPCPPSRLGASLSDQSCSTNRTPYRATQSSSSRPLLLA
jgi:hypothetical protein